MVALIVCVTLAVFLSDAMISMSLTVDELPAESWTFKSSNHVMLVRVLARGSWFLIRNLLGGVFNSESEGSVWYRSFVSICLLLFFCFGKFLIQVRTKYLLEITCVNACLSNFTLLTARLTIFISRLVFPQPLVLHHRVVRTSLFHPSRSGST